MTQSTSTLLRIAGLRNKARAGTMTLEDAREAARILREERAAVQQPTAGSRAKKATAPKPNADDLLSELDKL